MRSNLGWGMALVVVLAALLWAVETVRQTTPVVEVRVDLGAGAGAPAATAPPALTPTPAPSAVAGATATATARPAAGPTPTLPPVGAIVQYRIEAGDNLSVIAEHFNTTVAAILARNNISDPNLLYVGARIQVGVGEQNPIGVAPGATPGRSPQPAVTPGPAPPVRGGAPATPAPITGLEPTRPAQPPTAYEVYIPTASKTGQWAHFTCEFDAAWAIFKTYGLDVTLEQQLQIIGVDTSVTPTYKETAQGVEIIGGDIAHAYSGDYTTNFLARTTGAAMSKVFTHFGMAATPVHDQAGIEAALRAGSLVWIKTTVDFNRWVAATWIGPDGRRYPTVLGNDHAVVVAGFNSRSALIRDVLGPTSTNANRLTEYEVSWPTFLAAWGAQGYDGLAVARPSQGP